MVLLMLTGLTGGPVAQEAASAAPPDAGDEAGAYLSVEPAFTIWDVPLGKAVSAVPDSDAAIIACGTNGGPISIKLKSFADWAQCTPEASGLREVVFTYDDEQDYIARALELEFRALAGGTSVYAHPVVVSILVDDKGISQGIRIVTDDHATNVWWVALPSLGEGWHHNHHTFPRSAEHGMKKGELDASAALIRLLEKTGLAWNVVRISPERQEAKLVANQPASA